MRTLGNGENNNGKRNGYIFNVFVGVFAAIVSLLIGYMLNEISRINGIIAERGERITRLEGHNEFQDSEIKRMAEIQARAEAERREIFDYLTGNKKWSNQR